MCARLIHIVVYSVKLYRFAFGCFTFYIIIIILWSQPCRFGFVGRLFVMHTHNKVTLSFLPPFTQFHYSKRKHFHARVKLKIFVPNINVNVMCECECAYVRLRSRSVSLSLSFSYVFYTYLYIHIISFIPFLCVLVHLLSLSLHSLCIRRALLIILTVFFLFPSNKYRVEAHTESFE